MEGSISELLSMERSLRQRLSQLNSARDASLVKTTWMSEEKKVIDPTYDASEVDAMITNIDNALFKIDTAVKKSNANTDATVDVDYDSLMKPIKKKQ
jgi:hypothetical protein